MGLLVIFVTKPPALYCVRLSVDRGTYTGGHHLFETVDMALGHNLDNLKPLLNHSLDNLLKRSL